MQRCPSGRIRCVRVRPRLEQSQEAAPRPEVNMWNSPARDRRQPQCKSLRRAGQRAAGSSVSVVSATGAAAASAPGRGGRKARPVSQFLAFYEPSTTSN